MAQKYLIGFADRLGGLQTDLTPWLINENAFARLNNAYVYQGRVKKRFGSTLMGDTQLNSRLRMVLLAPGNVVTTPANVEIGQIFSIGNDIFTVNDITPSASLLTTSAVTATLTAANQVTFSAVASTVYFYPSLPVMGIKQFETENLNDEPTFALDTNYAYAFDEATGGWLRLSGGTDTWTGDNSQLFWSTNSAGLTANVNILWTTNFNLADGIRYWLPTVSSNPLVGSWTKPTLTYKATGGGGVYEVGTARIILEFKNRLIFLNTVETVDGTTNQKFTNRCRYSGVGSPLATNAWRQDIPGNGNSIDAATQEAIVTAQFLKDRLIVYFERSTWELAYTHNQVQPFTWQKINTELGAESTFSQVPFDRQVLGVGNVGIHACNGMNVERIDQSIDELVFGLHNGNSGLERVYGIRDFQTQMVYWAMPDADRTAEVSFPNKVLTYNYLTRSWGINDDSFTCFGYYNIGDETPGITWENADMSWEEADFSWNISSSNNPRTRAVLAGNQQGFMMIVNSDIARNSASLSITNIDTATQTFTIYDHNLIIGDYVFFESVNGISFDTTQIARVQIVTDENTFSVVFTEPFTGTYTGGGTAARVSKIDILTKEFNFFLDKGYNTYVPKVDFLVDRTSSGEVQVDYYVSSSTHNIVEDGVGNGALLGTSVLQTSPYDVALAPLEATQTRLWHPLYLAADGEFIQLNLYLTPVQMQDENIAFQDFELHAMLFSAMPSGSRFE